MFLEEIDRGIADTFVSLDSATGELLGYYVAWTVACESHLLNIAVAEKARGRGVGRRLLREGFRRAAMGGAERMLLEVRPGNDAALALYRFAGFVFSGVRQRYYTDTGEDAVLMERAVTTRDAE